MGRDAGVVMDDEDYIDAVADDCERILKMPFDDLVISLVETKYPWLKSGRVVWARTPEWKQALFWVLPDEKPMHLNGPRGLSYVSRMLVESTGPLPQSLPPTRLAETIRQLTYDPRGQVGSRDFLARVRSYIKNWLVDDNAASQTLFEEQCEDPVIHTDKETWTLTFRCLNVQGGVELWTVKGTSSRIQEAVNIPIHPTGTFAWPMA